MQNAKKKFQNLILSVIAFVPLMSSCVFSSTQFLAISDIHFAENNNSAMGNDVGKELLNSAMAKMRELSSDVDFILVMGDLPAHSLGRQPQKGRYEETVFEGLYQANDQKKPMFYLPGNNDSLKGNYQPFQFNGLSPLKYAKNWDGSCLNCKELLIDSSHMEQGGYYSSYVTRGNKDIILIALNTVQWTRVPFILAGYPEQERDAEEQMQWLEQQLKSHQAKQLLLVMHVPPGASYLGVNFWHRTYMKRFVELLQEHQKSYGEVSLITSHTHRDEFRKISLKNKSDIYAYSVPSISRVYLNNPGIKVFELGSEFKLINFTTYYTLNNLHWGSLHYKAAGNSTAILPECKKSSLAACLNRLSKHQVCNHLNHGMFYGVKSLVVSRQDKSCGVVYNVSYW